MGRRRFLGMLTLAMPGFLAADGLCLEPEWVRVRQLRLSNNPTHRLVHFTDFHFKGDAGYAAKAIQLINKQKPHFVCFTGDLIEETVHLEKALDFIRQIRFPVYGVPGNHEDWCRAPVEPFIEAFAQTGGQWLRNTATTIPDKQIEILGWADFRPGPIPQAQAAKRILLTHYPELADNTHGCRFDLILAGHSHGGQIRLPGYGPLFHGYGVGPYDMGRYDSPGGPLYVNPGIGTFFLPVRFNCRPEITVIEI
ncbi:MAG: metallophosphoesterase [Verrucomicrobiae bacterium]|nr:metallophosphoesterase [Verrucomicrobiae bacterium]